MVVTAVLAAVAACVVPGPVERARPEPAPAAAPITATDAGDALRQLADRAAAQPPPPDGRYDYVHTVEWTEDGIGIAEDAVAPGPARIETRAWMGIDGSLRREQQLIDETGAGSFPPHEVSFPPDGRGGAEEIPIDPVALREFLAGTWPPEGSAPLIGAVALLHQSRVVEPEEMAAILGVLAAEDGLGVELRAVDLLGREGVAVTGHRVAAGVTHRRSLILDATTGALLGTDQTSLDAGAPAGSRPSTGARIAFAGSGRVDTIGERP